MVAEDIKKVLDEMQEIYIAKNADYGNSFSNTYKKFGMIAPIVRMNDKMERLNTLINAQSKVKDESVRDTLLDLANYAVMTVVEMDQLDDEPYDYIFDMYVDEHEDINGLK